MHKENLPIKVDPFRFAENAVRLHGIVSVEELPRLHSSLNSSKGEVAVEMEFGVDAEGIRFVRGNLQGCLLLQCQRCLEDFDYAIISNFTFGLVNSEAEADQLPSRYDPIEVKEGSLMVRDIIEDELIVSLPIVPMHNPDDCKVKLSAADSHPSEVDNENPFKVVELLRSKREK